MSRDTTVRSIVLTKCDRMSDTSALSSQVKVWRKKKADKEKAKSLLNRSDATSICQSKRMWLLVGKALKTIATGSHSLLTAWEKWTQEGGLKSDCNRAWIEMRPATNCDDPSVSITRVFLQSHGVTTTYASSDDTSDKKRVSTGRRRSSWFANIDTDVQSQSASNIIQAILKRCEQKYEIYNIETQSKRGSARHEHSIKANTEIILEALRQTERIVRSRRIVFQSENNEKEADDLLSAQKFESSNSFQKEQNFSSRALTVPVARYSSRVRLSCTEIEFLHHQTDNYLPTFSCDGDDVFLGYIGDSVASITEGDVLRISNRLLSERLTLQGDSRIPQVRKY